MAELEVVEWPSFDELASLNMSLDAILVKSILEDLVVLNILVLVLGLPSNLAELESSWIKGIQNSTVNCSGGTLLNFGQVQAKKLVEPIQKLWFADKVGFVHHSNRF